MSRAAAHYDSHGPDGLDTWGQLQGESSPGGATHSPTGRSSDARARRIHPGVPCWVDTSQPDPEAAVDFYSGLFGREFENVVPSDDKRSGCRSSRGDASAAYSANESWGRRKS